MAKLWKFLRRILSIVPADATKSPKVEKVASKRDRMKIHRYRISYLSSKGFFDGPIRGGGAYLRGELICGS